MSGLFLGLFYGLRLCESNREKFIENATQQITIQIMRVQQVLYESEAMQKYTRKGTSIIMRCVLKIKR